MELPDDMLLGYLLGKKIFNKIIKIQIFIKENVMNIKLTNVSTFNHHLDESQFINIYDLPNQVTIRIIILK
jgi:hypothetical protein